MSRRETTEETRKNGMKHWKKLLSLALTLALAVLPAVELGKGMLRLFSVR